MSEEKEDAQGVVFLLIFGMLGSMVASALARGWVLSVMWGWFLVPLGLPTIGIAQAMGVALTVAALVGRRGRPDKDKKPEEQIVAIGRDMKDVFIELAFLLALGYVFHWCMK
jgi:hypothetical protein